MPTITISATGSTSRTRAVTHDRGEGVMAATSLAGIDDYMRGLVEFAQPVVPGSLRVLASVGDERNALLLVTVQATFGPGEAEATLVGGRLYLLDDDDKIKEEQVIFFAQGVRSARRARDRLDLHQLVRVTED
jgi:hypothetical protein